MMDRTSQLPSGAVIAASRCRRGARSAVVGIAASLIAAGTVPIGLASDDRPAAEVSAGATAGATDAPIWLSDRPEQDAHVAFGQFGKHGRAGFVNGRIAMYGVPSPHGLGMHPPKATVSYDLSKRYRTFRSTVAINDSSPGGSHVPIIFRVLADGKQVWESRDIRQHGTWQPVLLDITGVARLTLSVDLDFTAGDNSANAHAVWLEPYVSAAAPDADLIKLQAQEHYKEFDEAARYKRQVRMLLKDDKFADLEQLAAAARKKKDTLGDFPRLYWYYSALLAPFADSEAGRLEQIDRAADWQKLFPKSEIPRLIAADTWLSLANSGSGSIGAEEAMNRSQQHFEAAKSSEVKDAEFYSHYIALGKWQGWPRRQVDPLLEEAIKLDPAYYPAYQSMANYLLPERHGQPGDERELAETLRDRIGGTTGLIAYATVALHCTHYQGTSVLCKDFPYADLKPALLAQCRAFPALQRYVEMTAWLAGVSDDPATARAMFRQFPAQAWDSSIWGMQDEMENCRRWSAPDYPREELKTLHTGGDSPMRLAISPDGKSLATGGFDGRLALWDIATGKKSELATAPGTVNALQFDPKHARLLVACGERPVTNMQEWYARRSLPVGERPTTGALLLFNLDSQNVEGRQDPSVELKGHGQTVIEAGFAPDGKHVVSGSLDKTARIWSVEKPTEPMNESHAAPVSSVAWSPDGETICTASVDGEVLIRDAKTGKPVGDRLAADKRVANPIVRFLPDSTRLLVIGRSGQFQLWDIKTRKLLTGQAGGPSGWPGTIWRAVISPDGQFFALGRQSGSVELFETANLKQVHAFEGHWGGIQDLVFMPDSLVLVSASSDHTLKFWDIRTWTEAPTPAVIKP
jgi:WD40 repeat protein